ncbi:MAG: response regulator [Alphaproteobacteria bacterium]|nr:response regulator [Alphaproteobacteria bacterium]
MSDRKVILVVEDDFFAARDLQAVFERAGYGVLGPARSEEEALGLMERLQPDGAILDLNLGGRRSMRVVAALDARAIPFCIATGYSPSWIPPSYRSQPYLLKPYDPKQAVDIMARLIAKREKLQADLHPQAT